ncbi:hypothetical protein C807_02827 [Lachnospiraceae bacterium 28-4]|nr:hypothetical protein C807_02827 [Lachnospiraceae bacterium 28-4]
MNNPLVSIACITYNHEKYIRDAIEGFLAQKTSFDYEIIIHDDASTDQTADIIRQYEEKYPDKIRGIYQSENQFSKTKGVGITKTYVYPLCRGKYIALCEGDDFWIDPNKLQIQADYMESHPECVIACHDGICIDYKEFKVYPMHPYLEEKYLTEEEVIIQYYGDFPTASMMCRKDMYNFEGFFMQSGIGDYSQELYAITEGRIYFSTRIMSVYRCMHEESWCRVHSENIVQGLLMRGKVINFLRQYDEYTNRKYHYAIIYKELLFVLGGLHLCRNLGVIELQEFIQQCNEKMNKQYKEFFTKLIDVYRQMKEEAYYPESMKAFAEQYTYIYIYGAGKYGQRVAKQLLNNDKDFEAYIVSKPSGQKKEGKPVIGIDEIPYPMESVGIIIAVNVYNWNEIRGQFENNGRFNYIYPYGITEMI